MKNFWIWYNKQPAGLQLAIMFLIQWLYWLLAAKLFDYLIEDSPKSKGQLIFYATWMAFFMTIFFNLKKVKRLFNRKHD